ncbi:MAG: hypothetical protein ACYTEO_18015 [Planctomycetota bacterium]|jgi:hypothetical protein
MSLDKLVRVKRFTEKVEPTPRFLSRMLKWLEDEFWHRQTRILNWLLDRVQTNGYEVIKPDNSAGDNDNWRWTVDSNGDLVSQHKESGVWVNRGPKIKGS